MAESVVGLGFCLVVFTARPLFSVRQNVVLLRVAPDLPACCCLSAAGFECWTSCGFVLAEFLKRKKPNRGFR